MFFKKSKKLILESLSSSEKTVRDFQNLTKYFENMLGQEKMSLIKSLPLSEKQTKFSQLVDERIEESKTQYKNWKRQAHDPNQMPKRPYYKESWFLDELEIRDILRKKEIFNRLLREMD